LGKIPKGWSFGKLGDVCQVVPGYAFKSSDWQTTGVPVIKIKNIQSDNTVETGEIDYISEGISQRTNSKFVLASSDILLAMTGATAGKVGRLRTKQPMLLNQRVAKLVPNASYKEFVWCSVSTEEAKHRFFLLADGAAQPNMSGGQIEGVKLLIPTGELAEQFSNVVNPILTQTDNLYIEIQNLRKTRDLLLPRLLSGQINVD
jgi:type I restriction enzyme S subunit